MTRKKVRKPALTRYTANRAMTRVIRRLARKRHSTRAEVLQHALLLAKYLSEREAAGDTVAVYHKKTGVAQRITLRA